MSKGILEWEATIRYGTLEATYTVIDPRYYGAKIKALELFLSENKIPGRPWEFLSTNKKGIIEISVKSLTDKRKEPRRQPTNSEQYYLEQVVRLKKMVRQDRSFDGDRKRKVVGLLMQLEGVFKGG